MKWEKKIWWKKEYREFDNMDCVPERPNIYTNAYKTEHNNKYYQKYPMERCFSTQELLDMFYISYEKSL